MAIRPNIYQLPTTTEIMIGIVDEDGVEVIPTEARLTISVPNNTTVTVSGGDMTYSEGYYLYSYTPTVSGYYPYEAWIKDEWGHEASKNHAFHIVDRIS